MKNSLHSFYRRLLGLVFIVASVNSGITQAFNYLLSLRGGEGINSYQIFATMTLAILPSLLIGFFLLLYKDGRTETESDAATQVPLNANAQRNLLKILVLAIGLYFVGSALSDMFGIIFKYAFFRSQIVAQYNYKLSFVSHLTGTEDGKFFFIDIASLVFGLLFVILAKPLSYKLLASE